MFAGIAAPLGCAEGTPSSSPQGGILAVTAPNGDEEIVQGSSYEIRWSIDSSVQSVLTSQLQLELWRGESWIDTLGTSTASALSFEWQVNGDLALGGGYRIRIYHPTEADLDDESDQPFVIVEGGSSGLEIIQPNGGESWTIGSSQDISWSPGDEVDRVNVELRRGGFKAADVALDVENTGFVQWTVPDTLTPADDYRIRVVDVTSTGHFDDSDADFSIGSTPSITVTYPNGGEVFGSGQQVELTWTAQGVAAVDIALYKGGSLDQVIASDVAADSTYLWTLPAGLATGTDYRIRVANGDNDTLFDDSDADFSVVSWPYRRTIDITASGQAAGTTHLPVLVILDSSFDYSHAQTDGADLRFSTSDSDVTAALDHWIETWNPAGESWIWVAAPVQAGGAVTTPLYLFYGNPSATAPAATFVDVFPGAYQSSGGFSLSGVNSYDWFELSAGHVLSVGAGQVLEINAQRIIIAGELNGVGAGYAGGGTNSAGQGPGGGGTSSNSGCGGGGYGGAGGLGGYDSGDTPGAGGTTYGTSTVNDLDMGSGGGTNDAAGGNGGGAVILRAAVIEVAGNVLMNGQIGTASTISGRHGGGGAGGGILLVGDRVVVTGALQANGGAGGENSSSANDGGGGGGGGRVKLYYNQQLAATGVLEANGASGGIGGDISIGAPGQPGTTHQGQVTYPIQAVVGPETTL